MNMHSYVCCSNTLENKSNIIRNLSLFQLLSDKNRLQILCILQDKEHCVCEIESHIDASQSLISHHLISLKDADLVSCTKIGRKVMYTLTTKGKALMKSLSLLQE